MKKKILLVDDEPSIVKMVAKRLQIEGFEVIVAMDGQEALEKVQSVKPDLVVLDLMLPKLNGYEVCAMLKKDAQYQKIPVVIFTAKSPTQEDGPELSCGADAFLLKPFHAQEMLEKIRALVVSPAHSGFTLVELMLVIVIIAALAAMVVPRLAGRSEQARLAAAQADIKGNIALALRLYEVDNSRYPSTEQGLQALVEKPASSPVPANWKGPYLEQLPVDPWGKPYAYRYPGSHPPRDYDLYSQGPDGADGNDDITNW